MVVEKFLGLRFSVIAWLTILAFPDIYFANIHLIIVLGIYQYSIRMADCVSILWNAYNLQLAKSFDPVCARLYRSIVSSYESSPFHRAQLKVVYTQWMVLPVYLLTFLSVYLQSPKQSNQSFTIIPQSSTHVRIAFRNLYPFLYESFE